MEALLRDYRQYCEDEAERYENRRITENDYMFRRKDTDLPMTPNTFTWRFKLILNAMQDKKFPPQKVFYDGQIYEAFEQMKKFVRMAKQELIVIDPYFDDSVLPLIAQK